MKALRVVTAAACLALTAAGPLPASKPPEARGGEALCLFMYVSGAAAIAERCQVAEDPALNAELKASRALLEAYILRHKLLSPAGAAGLRNGGDLQRMSKAQACTADNLAVYRMWQDVGVAKLREGTEAVVARTEPAPGICL